ncbi:MAG TPA: DUF190 domain-containing protein [Steroidobacteraceae bacterium]|jgi:PII-like signaling protein
MEGYLLKFYIYEGERHHGAMAWEWLLQQANRLGIRGGSAFRAIAGFGHHHHLQEASFIELAGSVAVAVEFAVTEAELQELLELVMREKVKAFHVRTPAQFGAVGPP